MRNSLDIDVVLFVGNQIIAHISDRCNQLGKFGVKKGGLGDWRIRHCGIPILAIGYEFAKECC